MGSINWRQVDTEGNFIRYYSQTVPEIDIVTEEENYVLEGMYSNTTRSETDVDGTTNSVILAPGCMEQQQSKATKMALLTPRNTSSIKMRRFKNAVDTSDPISCTIPYDQLSDIYTNGESYPADSWKRFILRTAGFSMWINNVSLQSTTVGYNEEGVLTTYNYYQVEIVIKDADGNINSHLIVKSDSVLPDSQQWYGNMKGVKEDLWVSIIMIHKFNPKYYTYITNVTDTTGANGAKTGNILTGNEQWDNTYDLPFVIPFVTLVPSAALGYTYIHGTYENTECEVYSEDFDVIEYIKQQLFTANGLLSYYTSDFHFNFSAKQLNWRSKEESSITFDNQAMGSSIVIEVWTPYKTITNGIAYLTMAYDFNEREEVGEPTADIPTNKTEYNEGGTFTGYEDVGTDKVDGYNGWNVTAMNANHSCNFSNYIGTEQVIRDLIDSIFSLTDNGAKKLLALSSTWEPANVICRILELPYSNTWLFDNSDYADAAPAIGDKILTWEKKHFSSDQERKEYLAFANGMTVEEWEESTPTWFQSHAAFGYVPAIGDDTYIKYYKRASKRFINIPFGERTISRIYGDSDDFTDTQYILTLPGGETIELSPSQLFRNSDTGVPDNECNLKLDGILDIDSGDVLITITANNNMLIQAVVNVAIERSAGAQDSTNQLRSLVSTVAQLSTAVGGIVLGRAMPISYGTRQESGYVDRIVYNGEGKDPKIVPVTADFRYPYANYSNQAVTDGLKTITNDVVNEDLYVKTQETIGKANVNGSVKIIANQLPYLDIYYPIRQITENWKELRGYTSVSDEIGNGFNKYSVVDSIIPETANMLEKEKSILIEILKGGFYYNGNN